MATVKLEVHDIQEAGTCSLSAKEGEVLVVSMADGTVTESALSVKSLMQLLRLKLGQRPKKAPPPAVPAQAAPAGNGPPK